mgnify:FL=1|tara:strand:+ start:543 stop:851 length:309 start_codon:yes stop_codon:yes gene_type:complete
MTPLKKVRSELGLNRAEIARVCRIPYRTWIKWEDGERRTPGYAWVLLSWFLMNSSHIDWQLEHLEQILKDHYLVDGLTTVRGIRAAIRQSKDFSAKADSMVD